MERSGGGEGEVTVLDVRPVEEYRAAHIPGALSVPLKELERMGLTPFAWSIACRIGKPKVFPSRLVRKAAFGVDRRGDVCHGSKREFDIGCRWTAGQTPDLS
jgi:rhodanese-related sulfurtransferase